MNRTNEEAALEMTSAGVNYQEQEQTRVIYYARFDRKGTPVAATRVTYRAEELVDTKQGAYKRIEGGYKWTSGGDIPPAPYIAGAVFYSDTIPADNDAGLQLWNKLARADYVGIIPPEEEEVAEKLKKWGEKTVDREGVTVVLLTPGALEPSAGADRAQELARFWQQVANEITTARIGTERAGLPPFVILSEGNERGRQFIQETAAALHNAGAPKIIGAPFPPDVDSRPPFLEWIDPARQYGARLYDDRGVVHTDDERLRAAEIKLGERQAEEERARNQRAIKLADNWEVSAGNIPRPFKDATAATARKLNTPERTAAAVYIETFGAFIGDKATIKRPGGAPLAPYGGLVIVGASSAGKSPLMKIAARKLYEIEIEEGNRVEEEKKKIKPLKIELDAAQKELARKTSATRAADNPTDKANAQQAEELARGRYNEVLNEYARASAHARSYLIHYKSAAGVVMDLSRNAAAGRALNETNNGALVWLEEGARLFGVTQKADYTLDVFNDLSRILDKTTNGGTTATNESAADKNGKHEIGAGFIAGIQTRVCSCWQYDRLEGQGFLNRLSWFFVPYSERATSLEDIADELERYYALFDGARKMKPFGVIELDEEARALYERWRKGELKPAQNEANRQGNGAKTAFLGKLDEKALRLALVFHVAKELDAGRAELPCLLVDVETMQQAIDFCGVIAEERGKTLRQIALARAESIEAEELAQEGGGLSPAAQAVYSFLLSSYKWESVTAINAKVKAYQDKGQRTAIDQELLAAGLLVIGEHEHISTRGLGERHAVKARAASTAEEVGESNELAAGDADSADIADNPNEGANVGTVNNNEVPF